MTKSVIYETTGRAREYSELAVNLYSGCAHGCLYCWAPTLARKDPKEFLQARARFTGADIEQAAWRWSMRRPNDHRNVLLCFTTDPYTSVIGYPFDGLTREAIRILHQYRFPVTILTKAGKRAQRDFDLLQPGDEFAATLTLIDNADSQRWEPSAALPAERMESLQAAHTLGIRTWVSLEPVIHPGQTATLVTMTKSYVDEFRLGMMNYHEHGRTIDWRAFGWEMKKILDELGVRYYIKNDLRREMGHKDSVMQLIK